MLKLALAVAAAIGLSCAQAGAAVYTFTPTSIGPSPLPFVYTPQDATFTLGISDAAVQSGAFIYDYRYQLIPGGNPPVGFVASGDVQDLLFFQERSNSFTGGGGPGALSGEFVHVSLQFTPKGEVSAGQIATSTDSYGIDVSGSGGLFSGTFYIGSLRNDTVTGQFIPASVPEPATLWLLAGGVAFLGSRRRNCRAPRQGN